MSTFTLDIYKGWTEGQLRARCRELVRTAMHKDVIIAMLAKHGLESLSVIDRSEVDRICSQWED